MKKVVKIASLILAALVGIVLLLNLVPYEEYGRDDFTSGQHVEINGANIRFVQVGSGDDVLFIHGFPGSIEIFQPLVRHLQDDLKLTLYDRPGFGYSSIKNHEFDLNYEVAVAIELIRELKLQDVTVVGYSAGGPVAAQLALDYPEMVRHVILLGAALVQEVDSSDPLVNTISAPIVGKPLAMAFKYTMGAKAIRELFSEIAVVDERKAQVLYEEVHDLWLQTKTIVTICREIKNSIERDSEHLQSRLPSLTAKVTIVFGETDSFGKVEDAVATDAVLSNSELLILPDVGHFVHYLYPERVAEIILNSATSTETPTTLDRR